MNIFREGRTIRMFEVPRSMLPILTVRARKLPGIEKVGYFKDHLAYIFKTEKDAVTGYWIVNDLVLELEGELNEV